MENGKKPQLDEEYADLEALAKAGNPPPQQSRYRIRINKEHYNVDVPAMTGRQLLELAEKKPPERHQIRQKVRGELLPVGLDELVDFTKPGLERFQTIALDQTEG